MKHILTLGAAAMACACILSGPSYAGVGEGDGPHSVHMEGPKGHVSPPAYKPLPPISTKQLNKNSANASASASAGALAGSNSAVNFRGDTTITPRQVAVAPALGGLSSGPCTGASGGLSLGTLMFGGGLQGSVLDDQCTLRNNITTVGTADPELAREMMNDLDGVKDAKKRLGRSQ